MSLFWPKAIVSEPGPFGRAGRLIHWTALVVATLCVAAALADASQGTTDEGDGMISLIFFGGLGVVIYFAGRGMRYILAGE